MRCPQCGAPLDDWAQFCPRCGKRLEEAEGRKARTSLHTRQVDNDALDDADGAHERPTASLRQAGDDHVAASSAPHKRTRTSRAPSASTQTRKSRHKFIALVLGIAIVLVAGYLLWDVHMRPYGLNAKDFPSAGVRAAAASIADTDHDGVISRDEAAAVESLTITEGDKIYGFEVFPNLETLIIDSDETVSIDLSTAPQLRTLEVKHAPHLGEMLLKGNASLKTLRLEQTEMSSIDVSQAPHIETLSLASSPLKGIDVSHLKDLVSLNLVETDVERIDVAGLSNLSCMTCDNDVTVDNLSDTSLAPYWVIVDFQNNVPAFGEIPRQRAHIEAIYDDFNRLEEVRYEEAGELTLTPATASYEYDEAGHVVKATFEGMRGSSNALVDCTWTLAYDDRGNLVKATNDAGCTCAYTYDSSHRVATYVTTAPEGTTDRYTFTYNQAGSLTTMTHNALEKTLFSYNSEGQLTDATVIAVSDGNSSRTPTTEGEGSSRSDDRDASSSSSGAFDARTTNDTSSDSSGSSASSSSNGSASAGSEGAANDEGTAKTDLFSPESVLAATEVLASYAYRYDSDGHCIRCDYVSFTGSDTSYTETFTYASDGSLLNAQRNSRSGDASQEYLNHDITSARYVYASDGRLTSVSLTRADQSEGAHETYALKYQVVYAAPGFEPKGAIWQGGDPLVSVVDEGVTLATAVSNGQSCLTPWARLPHIRDMVFNRSSALFGAAV